MNNSSYKYPQIFVNESLNKISLSSKVILETRERKYCLMEGLSKELLAKIDVKRVFELKPYETAYEEIVDLESAKITKSFIVYSPKTDTYMLIEENVNVQLLDILGLKIFLAIGEGDFVKKGDIIGYQVTGKFEVRNIICNGEGVVVYIGTVFEEIQHYIVVLVGEGNVERIKVSECL